MTTDRRTFFGAAAAFVGSFFLPKASASPVSNKWWTERKSTFDGVPITYYDWPKDRLLQFTTAREQTEFGVIPSTVLVPTFHLSDAYSNLDDAIRDSLNESIKDQCRSPSFLARSVPCTNPHIIVAKIIGYDDLYAICVNDGPYEVTIDCYEGNKAYSLLRFARRPTAVR